MKKRYVPFDQYLVHQIEDEDKVMDYLDETLPNIGLVVMGFNGLEKDLDRVLCEIISDRTDTLGLLVLQNMQFSAKVNLFSRFSDELHRTFDEVPAAYEKLLDRMRESTRQRNTVVHADWESTDDEGYTYSKLRLLDGGMEQEYVQLSSATLESTVDTILAARQQLEDYWEARQAMLQRLITPNDS